LKFSEELAPEALEKRKHVLLLEFDADQISPPLR
jgi:hypothetical protein